MRKTFAALLGLLFAAAASVPTLTEAGIRMPNHNETLLQGK